MSIGYSFEGFKSPVRVKIVRRFRPQARFNNFQLYVTKDWLGYAITEAESGMVFGDSRNPRFPTVGQAERDGIRRLAGQDPLSFRKLINEQLAKGNTGTIHDDPEEVNP